MKRTEIKEDTKGGKGKERAEEKNAKKRESKGKKKGRGKPTLLVYCSQNPINLCRPAKSETESVCIHLLVESVLNSKVVRNNLPVNLPVLSSYVSFKCKLKNHLI